MTYALAQLKVYMKTVSKMKIHFLIAIWIDLLNLHWFLVSLFSEFGKETSASLESLDSQNVLKTIENLAK